MIAASGGLGAGVRNYRSANGATTFSEKAASDPAVSSQKRNDGTITLLGRGSGCINSGGEKIFPDEIEAVLAQHPGVRHAAVVGVPAATWLARVVALVEVLDPGAPPSLEEIEAHCRPLLAGYKMPRALVVGPLHRTPTGKVDYVWARAHAIAATGARD